MRRHAEGLIILSGAAPGRSWRKPVPLIGRGPAPRSREVEDYARVVVPPMPPVGVGGGRRRRRHPSDRRTRRERHRVLPAAHPGRPCAANGSATASPWRSTTAASAWPRETRRGQPQPRHAGDFDPPTATGSASSSSAGSPRGTASRSRCAGRRTAARPRWCCCRRRSSRPVDPRRRTRRRSAPRDAGLARTA